MNIQYSKKKQEIRQDPVMDSLIRAKEYLQANMRQIGIGAAVVAAGVVIVFGATFMLRQQRTRAQAAYGTAMIAFQKGEMTAAKEAFSEVTERFGNSVHAGYSAFMLGSIAFKAANYDEAIQWFEKAAGKSRSGSFVPGQALEGLAASYEAKGDLEKAYQYLRDALKDPGIAFHASSIRWKLTLLAMDLKKTDDARAVCKTLAADSLAGEYRFKAENLLLELQSL